MYKHACNKWFSPLFCPRPTGCGFMCGVHLLLLSNRCWNFKHIFSFLNINSSYTWTSFTHTCFLFLLFISCDKSIIFLFKHSTSLFFFNQLLFRDKNFIVCFSQLGFLPFQLLFLMKYQWFNFTSCFPFVSFKFPNKLSFLITLFALFWCHDSKMQQSKFLSIQIVQILHTGKRH